MDTKWITIYGKKTSYRFCPFDRKYFIGEGGMGRVFLGYDNSTGQKVAVKAVFTELAKRPNIKERSELEAHLQFSHDNLIKMLDCCITAEGRIHIVSNFIEGKPIGKYLTLLNVSAAERAKIILELALPALDGLDFLHLHNVTHRDVKPENIMIASGPKPVLMDLGVARASNGKRLTRDGVVIGTPHYSAPEQILGEWAKINPTTDLYAMGITLYELLTGNPPFNGSSEFDVMKMQVAKTLPKHPALSAEIFGVLKKATEKKQEKRYQTAKELQLAIKATLINKPLWQRILNKITR